MIDNEVHVCYIWVRRTGELGSWGAGELGSWGAGELGDWGTWRLGVRGQELDCDWVRALFWVCVWVKVLFGSVNYCASLKKSIFTLTSFLQ